MLSVADAAVVLGVPKGTLRRWVREGCPTASRGQRGRGHAMRIDPEAVRKWRAGTDREQLILELASSIPDLLAVATRQSFQLAEGVDKRRLAGVLAATWYLSTTEVLDSLRAKCPNVPDVSEFPDEIQALRKIAR